MIKNFSTNPKAVVIPTVYKVAWLAASVATASIGFLNGDTYLYVAFLIVVILTFPLGIVAAISFGMVTELLKYTNFKIGAVYGTDLIICSLMILFGYLQWFVLLPILFGKYKDDVATRRKWAAVYLVVSLIGFYWFYNQVYPT